VASIVNAIIFLAPISAFDQVNFHPTFAILGSLSTGPSLLIQVLAEVCMAQLIFRQIDVNLLFQDPRINRLEDSLLLWKSLVSQPLLSKVNVVLFLNKCDLLQVSYVSLTASL